MKPKRLLRTALFMAFSLCMLLAAFSLTALLEPHAAYAHSFVIGSDPVDGSTISAAPPVVRIFFDAPISPSSKALVENPQQQVVNAARSFIPANHPDELDTPLNNYRHLPLGGYTVRWTAIGSADGFATHGVIGFNIGYSSTGLSGVTIVGPTTSNISPVLDSTGLLSVAWEWLVLAALSLWIGILVVEGLALNGIEHERRASLLALSHKQARPLQWLCLAALFVGEIIVLFLRDVQYAQLLNGSAFDLNALTSILFQSMYGYLWIAREALILCAMGVLWFTALIREDGEPRKEVSSLAMKRAVEGAKNDGGSGGGAARDEMGEASFSGENAARRRSSWVFLALAALIVLTRALSGNAAQLSEPFLNSVVFEWLYLAAQAVWLGGLAYIAYILLPLVPLGEQDRRSETLPALLQRCQPYLLWSAAVVVIAELLLSEASLDNLQLFFTDPYGRTFLIKWALIVILVALTLYVFATLRPKLRRQAAFLPVVDAELPARRVRQFGFALSAKRLRLLLRAQTWIGAAVLLCVALMAFFAPPIVFPNTTYSQYPNASSGNSESAVQTQTHQVGDLTVTLTVKPAQVGKTNTVSVTLKDTHTGKFVTNALVKASTNMQIMDMGTSTATLTGGNPTYSATFTPSAAFSMSGAWNIDLFIEQPGQTALSVQFSITVG
jgi:putative copper export protein/methionine-rich copper-binding protein CopC